MKRTKESKGCDTMKKVLCFGDSNTWGYIPETAKRYKWGQRWTSLLQEAFGESVSVLEEGLCGRTTIFEDKTRPNRNGKEALRHILEENKDIDAVVLMLGTNDCKSFYDNSAQTITQGIRECLELVLKQVSPENVLLLSPILLGERVWQPGFDPEFNSKSVEVSKQLKKHYQKLAKELNVHFLAASDYASPSEEDQEHMSVHGHRALYYAIYEKLANDILGEYKDILAS